MSNNDGIVVEQFLHLRVDTQIAQRYDWCMTKTKVRDDAFVDRIAKAAIADKKTVIRLLAGLPVRGKVGERIQAAIEKEEGK